MESMGGKKGSTDDRGHGRSKRNREGAEGGEREWKGKEKTKGRKDTAESVRNSCATMEGIEEIDEGGGAEG